MDEFLGLAIIGGVISVSLLNVFKPQIAHDLSEFVVGLIMFAFVGGFFGLILYVCWKILLLLSRV